MKIVQVSSFETTGGAARAAYRLHQGLRSAGVESAMVVWRKTSDDPSVVVASPTVNSARAIFDQELHRALGRKPRAFFSTAALPERNVRPVQALAPDIVNLHWIGGNFLRPESLARVGRPLVWTLHDSWAFTGGCHLTGDCERYTRRCGACPALGSRHDRDLSRWIWWRKQRAWSALSLVAIAPSRWMAQRARRSSLFGHRRVEVIPNGIDTSVFRRIEREVARDLLRLPRDRRLVLFIAAEGTSDPIKGFHLLEQSLRHLVEEREELGIELVVAGASQISDPRRCGVPVRCVGRVADDVSLALLYSAADVVAVPSVQENFPNAALEALACGCPVVAFRIGGLPEIVEDGVDGSLAEPFDTAALARGILWSVEDEERRRALSAAARSKAEREYALEIQARRYVALYEDILRSVQA